MEIPDSVNDEEAEEWKVLNSYINMSIENHLADIRPSKKFNYSLDDFKNETFYLINALHDYIENSIKTGQVKQTSDLENDVSDEPTIPATIKTISSVHSLLTRNKFSYDDLSEEDLSQMQEFMAKLLHILITNRDNTAFNKGYIKHYLTKKSINYNL